MTRPIPPVDDQTSYDIDVPMVIQLRSGNLRPLTQNDRLHHQGKGRLVKTIRSQVGWRAKAAKIPKAEYLTVQLHYETGPKASITDAPNLTATSKPAIDALVDAGIVPNDTDRHVLEVMPVIHTGGAVRRCWLHIEPRRQK
jgi:crossover junction endodeoxyribonuclease RusA